jgi:predicted KAP-like P-loop ATPase
MLKKIGGGTMDELGFADDQPIKAANQDLLGRSIFAKNLATAICGWKNNESLVIALMGPWGSGKSSIKNLAVQELNNIQDLEVIEYNPWEWNGQEKLSASFFNEVSRAIRRKDKSKNGKKLARVLLQYGHRINAGAEFVDGMTRYLPLFLGSALITSYLGTWMANPTVQVLMNFISSLSALAALPALLKKAGKFLVERAESIDRSAKEAELTLIEIRDEIRTLLNKRKHPLLIVMDDIDRVSSDEIKALFQLVKGNMDFPNVVFLLLFQRDIVEQGLDRTGFKGAEYLEKIIQVPFSVPAMSRERLESVLFKRLEAILACEPQLSEYFNSDRWHSVYQKGMQPFFRSLRDVYRYTSTLAFHCRLMRGTNVAEINPVDLFALECLRTFAPASYAALARHKEMLTGGNTSSYHGDKQAIKSTIQIQINSIVDLASEHQRSSVNHIIKKLFPTLDWVYSNSTHAGRTQINWLRESRVCRTEIFSRYFELALPFDDIPNSLIHALMLLLPENSSFCNELLQYTTAQQNEIFDRLESRIDEFPIQYSEAVIVTLLKAGEIVDGDDNSMFSLSGGMRIYRLVLFFLQRHDTQQERSGLLLSAFKQAKGFVVVERLLMSEAQARSESDPADLDDAGYEELKGCFVESLLSHATQDPNAFFRHWNFKSYVYRLNRFASDAGRDWVKKHITSTAKFIQFAEALVSKSTAYSGNSVSQNYYIRVRTLEDLYSIEACKEWMDKIDKTALNGKPLNAINLVAEALGRHERGEKTDYD